jgi:hypothetical protein
MNAQGEGHSAMSNERRADLLEAIAELRRRYPDWRLGQLVANVAGWADQEIWNVEDEQLLAAAQLHLQQLAPSGVAPSGRTPGHT